VDLNRNYEVAWGGVASCGLAPSLQGSTDGSCDTYIGTAPFSEPETQVIRDFVNDKRFECALSWHSHMGAILWPHGNDCTDTVDDARFLEIAQMMHDYQEADDPGSGYDVAQSIPWYCPGGSNGDWEDWMYEGTGHAEVLAFHHRGGERGGGGGPFQPRNVRAEGRRAQAQLPGRAGPARCLRTGRRGGPLRSAVSRADSEWRMATGRPPKASRRRCS